MRLQVFQILSPLSNEMLWKLKFGDAKNDGPGPNPSSTTTTVTDDVFLILTTNKEVEVIQSQVTESKLATGAGAPAVSTGEQPAAAKIGKYIAPGLREGAANRRGETMPRSQRDESANIRVTNLSENTRESDLMELFRPFGPISRIFLAKGKQTNQSKGFAFINFVHREDAARAIQSVQGFGYDHLILNVEWAKPSTNQQ
ncbi:eukaryotic translation initiation factor 3 subunit G-like [Montipora foliosa]|uniref:eukaryotic translation initiation factor 3 subunit G-like n=1 Tax=Montipora foliosa TaxID=591990 RepID=UPI0035F1C19B